MAEAVTFNITRSNGRCPAIELDNSKVCLFDTGAWMTLVDRKYADKLGDHSKETMVLLSGFGGDGELTPVHYWKCLPVRQGSSVMYFMNTLSFVTDYDKYDMILSPFYLFNRDIRISASNELGIRGHNVIECNYRKGSLPPVIKDDKELLLMLSQL